MPHLGWILDLYQKDGQMVVWLKKPDGKCVRLVDEWKPRIHVAGEYRELLDLADRLYPANSWFIERYEKPGDGKRSRVLEVEVSGDREAVTLATRIQRQGNYKFRLFDVDIPAPQMYLYQKDLFPLAFVEAEVTGERVLWSLKDSRETIDYLLPPLRKIGLQVKTKKNGSIQCFNDELDTIRIFRDDGETVSIGSGNEAEKILTLMRVFKEADPDIVLTEGGDSFIFPYLTRRAHELEILDDLVLGREPSPLRVYEIHGHSYFSYGKILYRETAARLFGRLHIDENNAFISNDCGLEGLFEVSRTCIVPVQRASRATIGTNMTSLQLYHAVKQDVLIPWNKNESEEWKDGNELVVADRGGFVYEPEAGIHDEVGEVDFSSLYPMVMLKENLSGETVKCGCCIGSTIRVPELGYNICQRWQGIVPRSLDILLRKRMLYQKFKNEATDPPTKERFEQRQAALKWILVCS